MAPPAGFHLDSLVVFVDGQGQPIEVEWIYEHAKHRGHYVRCLAWAPESAHRLKYPPQLDRQPCTARTHRIHGREVFHAFLDPRYGQHEAVWRTPAGLLVMLLLKPAPWTDEARFLEIVGPMVAES